MKYIKSYENQKNNPQPGDYVVVKIKNVPSAIAAKLEEYIGHILRQEKEDTFLIKFGKITMHWYIKLDDIVDWSKNKEDLEYYIQSNKYNL